DVRDVHHKNETYPCPQRQFGGVLYLRLERQHDERGNERRADDQQAVPERRRKPRLPPGRRSSGGKRVGHVTAFVEERGPPVRSGAGWKPAFLITASAALTP